MEESKISYYAVVPANVRYDDTIPQGAKLLYGEITALCNSKGFCWATNDYFAQLYKCSKHTISVWVSALRDKGYIYVEINRGENNEIVARYIRINSRPIAENVNTLCTKSSIGIAENVHTPIDKNVKENNTVINITNNNNKETIRDIFKEFANGDKELLVALNDFEKMRNKIKKPLSDRAKTLLISSLTKLSKSSKTQIAILNQSILHCWQTVYELKDDAPRLNKDNTPKPKESYFDDNEEMPY